MLELCMSGKACRIFLLSSLAHTMKAFMGRLMWLLFLDSGKCREPARQSRGRLRAGGEGNGVVCPPPTGTCWVPPCPTVHLAAEQSLVQAVRGGLLQPLLHRGSIQADVILCGEGAQGCYASYGDRLG